MSNCANRKGQISVEFFALNGFLLIVFLALLIVIQQRGSQITQENSLSAAQQLADVVVREVRYAYVAGDGYTRDFSLPRTIAGAPYALELIQGPDASTISVRYRDDRISRVVLPLPQRVINATNPLLPPEKPRVQNVGGRVFMYLPEWLW